VKTLASDRNRETILTRLASLRPEDQRRWGRMSAHQAVCHLSDSFRVPLGIRHTKPIPASPLKRALIKWAALYLPVPWPKGVPTMPENDQFIGGSPPRTFEGDRRELGRLINEFASATHVLKAAYHPMFGTMPIADWQRWGYLHADHHLRQFGV
jgi:hypothetical protein